MPKKDPAQSTGPKKPPQPVPPFAAGARQLARLLAVQRTMLDSGVVEVNLPLVGASGLQIVEVTPGTFAAVWHADGTKYVAQERDLRMLAATFDALADQLMDMQPIYNGVPTPGVAK